MSRRRRPSVRRCVARVLAARAKSVTSRRSSSSVASRRTLGAVVAAIPVTLPMVWILLVIAIGEPPSSREVGLQKWVVYPALFPLRPDVDCRPYAASRQCLPTAWNISGRLTEV